MAKKKAPKLPTKSAPPASVQRTYGDRPGFNRTIHGKPWWEDDQSELQKAQDVFGRLQDMLTQQQVRQFDYSAFGEMYAGGDLNSYLQTLGLPTLLQAGQTQVNLGPVLNHTANIVNTADALLDEVPTPNFMPLGDGGWGLDQACKKRTLFAKGLNHASGFNKLQPAWKRSACIFGTGAIKSYKEDGQLKKELAHTFELFTDDVESVYGMPRTLTHKRHISRDVLLSLFGEPNEDGSINATAEQIKEVRRAIIDVPTNNGDLMSYAVTSDIVKVVESWHLPSSELQDDGRHLIAIENGVLFEEKWTRETFPFTFLKWCFRPVGFWGQGICEQGRPLQNEINKTVKRIAEIIRRSSVNRILARKGSIVEAHWSNKIGDLVFFTGERPIIDNSNNVPPELWNYLDYLIKQYYALTGIPMVFSQGEKSTGDNSGIAKRTQMDIYSQRFVSWEKAYQDACMESSMQDFELVKEIVKEDGKFELSIPYRGAVKKLSYKDVDLDEDQFIQTVEPSNLMADDPAGRKQDAIDLASNQILDQTEMLYVLKDVPDLQELVALKTAPLEAILRAAGDIIEEGIYTEPEDFMDLKRGIIYFQALANKYKNMKGFPQERVQMFINWYTTAQDILDSAAAQVAAQQAALNPPAVNPGVNVPAVGGPAAKVPTPTAAAPLNPGINPQ
jgi:hypothetical protein